MTTRTWLERMARALPRSCPAATGGALKLRSCIALLGLAILAALSMPFSTAYAAEKGRSATITVKLVDGLTQAEQEAVIARDGGTEKSAIAPLRLHVVTVPVQSLHQVRQNYLSDKQVESVEVEKRRKAQGIPSDPNYGIQWSLPQIGYPQVYGVKLPLGTAKVAVLDTGVDASHPDLAANLVPGASFVDGAADPQSDHNGHGTAMAGIVAAATGNGAGIAGVAFQGVSIMPVTVLDAEAAGQDSDIIKGIVWAADHGADVILMAFANPEFSQHLQDAIDYAWSKGAVLVSAVGNDAVSTPSFPAGDRGVIGVSATDQNDRLAPFSNFGQSVFLAAPGTGIYTTGLNGTYSYLDGTSASSAMVAGVAAFLKAVDPELTNGVIVARLAKSADAIGTAGDSTNQSYFGNGRVNMASALASSVTESLEPAGAAPVGAGGPYVGPYYAAAANKVTSIAIKTGQNGALNYGVIGNTTFVITLNLSGGSTGSTSLSINNLPSGASLSPMPPITLTAGATSMDVTATVTSNGTTPVGTSNISFKTGNVTSPTTPLTVGKGSTTTAVATSQSPSHLGQGVTFTATVTKAGNGVTPTGNVAFLDGSTQIGTATLSSGVATLSYGSLSLGSHTITASYLGDGNYIGSSGTVSQELKPDQSITVTQAAPSSAFFTATFTVAATTSSNLPVAIATSGSCSGGGSSPATISMSGIGTTCTVTYSQDGDSQYFAAPVVTSNTTVQFPVLRISDQSSFYYTSLQSAYNGSLTGDVLEAIAGPMFGDLLLDRNIETTFIGGMNATFTTQTGVTSMTGNLEIVDGTLTVENLELN